ncbi:unnamed protein product [Eretmochelys imbricata]
MAKLILWTILRCRKGIFVGRDVDHQDSSPGKYGSVMRTDTEQHGYGESLGHIQKEKSFRKTKPAPPRSVSEPGIRAVGSEKWTLVTPVPHLKCHCYTQRISAPILSKEEIQAVEREKKDLQYQMLTLEARVMRTLKWKMDVYLPGYKKQVAAVSTSGHLPLVTLQRAMLSNGVATREGWGSSRVPNSSQARKMKGSKTKKHRETWVQK